MSVENVSRFGVLIREDKELQAKLQAAAQAYTGDRHDEPALFEATVGKVAAEAGIPFTLEEAYESAFGSREIDDAELDRVAGGGGCIIIGISEPEADCFNPEGIYCAYFGITIDL